jgi:hypothetical protein
LNRDRDALYRGVELSHAQELAQANKGIDTIAEDENMISATEREFLDASAKNEIQEETQRHMLMDALFGEGLLPFAVAWAGVGFLLREVSELYFFWTQVIAFAMVGFIRGYSKELLFSVSVLVTLVFNRLLDCIPWMQSLPQENPALFWARILAIGIVTYVLYQFVNGNQRKWARIVPRAAQDKLIGSYLGAINGYLFQGTILYYLYISDYTVLNDPDLSQAVAQMMRYMPPALLSGSGIYIALFIAVILFVIIFEDLFWSEDTKKRFLSKLGKQASMWVRRKYIRKPRGE